jgi:hypothetical protein
LRYSLVVLALFAGAARATEMSELNYDVVLLADPIAARDDKLAAVDELTKAQLAAVPLLVERLKDTGDAVFLDDVGVETGPMNPGPPVVTRTTARFMAELILYRIIAPDEHASGIALGARSSKSGLDATRPAGGLELEDTRPPIAWVRDWSAFWSKHKGDSLDEIKRWSSDEIDRIWREAALASTPAPPVKGSAPHLPSATTGAAADLASSGAGILLSAWRDPSLTPARDAYVKARAIFADAKRDPSKRSSAKKQLEELAKKEPRLKVHVEHWVSSL